MAQIVPTVTAFEPHEYRVQMERVAAFAGRVHIDLMDGEFAPSVSPALSQIWWPHHVRADIHLMYKKPMEYLEQLIALSPHMVIVHNEAEVHHMHFAAELHKHNIKTGLAILQDTPVAYAEQVMHSYDHVLVFSGDLGYHGGTADTALLPKVKEIKAHHPEVEIGWDGGINDSNAPQLVKAGVEVLNVGGFIQNADDPQRAYGKLVGKKSER